VVTCRTGAHGYRRGIAAPDPTWRTRKPAHHDCAGCTTCNATMVGIYGGMGDWEKMRRCLRGGQCRARRGYVRSIVAHGAEEQQSDHAFADTMKLQLIAAPPRCPPVCENGVTAVTPVTPLSVTTISVFRVFNHLSGIADHRLIALPGDHDDRGIWLRAAHIMPSRFAIMAQLLTLPAELGHGFA
jgi:hypothetical protein